MWDSVDKAWHIAMCRSQARFGLNRLHYGAFAPRPDQLLSLSPTDIPERYTPKSNGGLVIGARRTGQVSGGSWDQHRGAFTRTRKYKACVARFRDGASWEDSGIIDYSLTRIAKTGPFDGCATKADILARYAALDGLWQITNDQSALPASPQSASDGILVHFDRDGLPLFGNQGFHRLAIAKLAGLDKITVSLGIVHPDALRDGLFQRTHEAP